MTLSPLAGRPAPTELLIDVDRLVKDYYTRLPATGDPQQLVHFGANGHRGTPEEGSFNEAHILAISQAICDYRTGKDPGELYRELTTRFGTPCYTRIDVSATPSEKVALEHLSPEAVTVKELAGEPILAKLSAAPGNGEPIGGLKVMTASGWFGARPSGTESIYKIYAESLRDQAHLDVIVKEAQGVISKTLAGLPV